MGKFCRDLEIGHAAEQQVIRLFTKCGFPCQTNSTNLTTHDFTFQHDNKEWSVEVKFDKWQHKSGNIAIEYFNPKLAKPSGILATTSQFWVVVLLNGQIWMAKTDALRKHFNTEPGIRDVLSGGDGNASFRLYRDSSLFGSVFFEIDEQTLRERILND